MCLLGLGLCRRRSLEGLFIVEPVPKHCQKRNYVPRSVRYLGRQPPKRMHSPLVVLCRAIHIPQQSEDGGRD